MTDGTTRELIAVLGRHGIRSRLVHHGSAAALGVLAMLRLRWLPESLVAPDAWTTVASCIAPRPTIPPRKVGACAGARFWAEYHARPLPQDHKTSLTPAKIQPRLLGELIDLSGRVNISVHCAVATWHAGRATPNEPKHARSAIHVERC